MTAELEAQIVRQAETIKEAHERHAELATRYQDLMREVTRYANALSLMRAAPSVQLAYCKTNKLLPDPITVEASTDEYWRKAIVNEALGEVR